MFRQKDPKPGAPGRGPPGAFAQSRRLGLRNSLRSDSPRPRNIALRWRHSGPGRSHARRRPEVAPWDGGGYMQKQRGRAALDAAPTTTNYNDSGSPMGAGAGRGGGKGKGKDQRHWIPDRVRPTGRPSSSITTGSARAEPRMTEKRVYWNKAAASTGMRFEILAPKLKHLTRPRVRSIGLPSDTG